MVSISIDVSKDKHDCFIINSEGVVLANVFTIPNNMDGFNTLLDKIHSCTTPQDSIKVGLKATGHYSYNILGFLLDNGLTTYVLNPLRTNLYWKSLSLRKTKANRVDARTIAAMLMSDLSLKPYTDTVYHNEELKSLTRYRFDKVKERAKLKQSIARLVCILFPELEKLVPTLHATSVYALLDEFPGVKQIASVHLTRLKALLKSASKGHYKRDMAVEIRDAARRSIGVVMPVKSLELRHTIRLIRELDTEINEIESAIQSIMDDLRSPITTILGFGFRMAAMILAEVGGFSRFDSPDKLPVYAGMSPSTYQSGQLKNCTRTWRNEVPDTFAMPFTMPPSMSAIGTQHLPPISPRNGQRKNTTTPPSPTPPKSWCVLSSLWRNPVSRTASLRNLHWIAIRGPSELCFVVPF